MCSYAGSRSVITFGLIDTWRKCGDRQAYPKSGSKLAALAVVSGLTAVFCADQRLRTVPFVASVCYPGCLALRVAFAGSKIALIARQHPPGITGAILLHRTERAINIAMAFSMLATSGTGGACTGEHGRPQLNPGVVTLAGPWLRALYVVPRPPSNAPPGSPGSAAKRRAIHVFPIVHISCTYAQSESRRPDLSA
jgi:hypothetical protein